MKRFFRRIPLPAKLFLIVIVPLALSIYLFIELYAEKANKIRLLENYIQRVKESADITRLIASLESERDYSYLSKMQGNENDTLTGLQKKTDSIIKNLSASSRLKDFPSYTFLSDLDSTRAKIARKIFPAKQIHHYYTTAIFRLNSLNTLPQSGWFYFPDAQENMLSQKLLSEMLTYLSIARTNVYNALYTESYMLETLVGTYGTYQVYKSFENEFYKKTSAPILAAYSQIRESAEMKATADYLDSLFTYFKIRNDFTATAWKQVSDSGLNQVKRLQQDLLLKATTTIEMFYKSELKSRNRTFILLLVILGLVAVLLFYTIYSITQVLTELRKDAELISGGASGMYLNGVAKDVIGQLADSIRRIDENNKVLASAAALIGKGDFSVPVQARGNDDVLGNAIINMKEGLQQITIVEQDVAKLAAIVQSSLDAIVGKTLEGIVTSWNPGAERLFGYSAAEMIGQPISRIFLPDNLKEEDLILEKIRQGERVEHMDTIRRHKSGRLINVSLTISPVKDNKGRVIGVSKIVRDITAQKEEELRKNQFLTIASHELKTPLTSAKAYTQLLTEKYQDSNDVFLQNALSKVEGQVNKMGKLVEDFLNLSKIQSEKFELNTEEFDLGGLIRDVVGDLKMLIIQHEVNLHIPGKFYVIADREKISQVIINFLNNAVKYSPGEKDISVILSKENGQAKVSVADKGIGIKKEEQQKIFERFYRSKFNDNISFSGFGIGLYISAEIIRLHDGTFGVTSREGNGSTFYFTIPLKN